MKFRIDSRATHGLMPASGAATSVMIISAFLVAMVGIAVFAYAKRDRLSDIPPSVDKVAAAMTAPARDERLSTALTTISRRPQRMSEVPRLAALASSDTRPGINLIAPLSRSSRRLPSAVPAARPPRAAIAPPARPPRAATAERARPAESVAKETHARLAAIRPKPRPDTLSAAPAPARTARRARPEASATLPRADAARPAKPQIADASASCPRHLVRSIPRRTRNAPGGRAFMAHLDSLDGVKRDRLVADEILGGNVPGFLRNLVPVSIAGRSATGAPATITLCVTPDYLALGSNRDFVRVPLGLRAATRIGNDFNMLLPTPRMVDMIYRAANLRLPPQPMTPGPRMTSTAYLLRHNQTIMAQRTRAGAAIGTLIAGQKKDVVLTRRLASHPGRVAIYGWHRPGGRPIQPLSTVHGAGYADYSHGIRLVSRTAFLNGRAVDLRSLLADQRYAVLLSDEGPVGGPRLRMVALATK